MASAAGSFLPFYIRLKCYENFQHAKKCIPSILDSAGPVIDFQAEKVFSYELVQRGFTDDGGAASKDKKGNVKMWETDDDAVFWPVEQ